MNPPASQYQYNPPLKLMVLCTVVAGIACAFLANQALHNDAGLIINGIIRLDQTGATIFFWLLAAVSGVGAFIGALASIQSCTNPQTLRFDHDAMTLPHGFLLRESARIPYSTIRAIGEQEVSSQVFLNISAQSGNYTLRANYLPKKDDYQAVKSFLVSQISK